MLTGDSRSDNRFCEEISCGEDEPSLNLLGALPAGGGDVSPLGGESGAEALPAALHEGALLHEALEVLPVHELKDLEKQGERDAVTRTSLHN